MAVGRNTSNQSQFADFQTPPELAREACSLLAGQGLKPASVLEPTCGKGNFLKAALACFATVTKAAGIELNRDHVEFARAALQPVSPSVDVQVIHADLFQADCGRIVQSLPSPLLIIGNPPWITNSRVGSLRGTNLPQKSNFQNHRGIDALTGASNFDIAEWILIAALGWAKEKAVTVAMLCKCATARKVLLHAWKTGIVLRSADMYLIDAPKQFGASVQACLFVVTTSQTNGMFECTVHSRIVHGSPVGSLGYRGRSLVADATTFDRYRHLDGQECRKWRSGIKHDCAAVMEFVEDQRGWRNGLGEVVSLETNFLYPMLKSSALASKETANPRRWMLVTQEHTGCDTTRIRQLAPKTWMYLNSHAAKLDRRASIVYKNRPRFAVFGVGAYAFAPRKVAISGLYKTLDFQVLGPFRNKPIVLDDTCYFIACNEQSEAALIAKLLNSRIARTFLDSMIFWDAKRPVTAGVLRRLDLRALAKELDLGTELARYLPERF